MPFDDASARAEIAAPEEVRILDEMAALLAKPADWTKDTLSRTGSDGHVSRCLYGALLQADHGNPDWAFSPVRDGFFQRVAAYSVEGILNGLVHPFGTEYPIAAFNNHPDTTHADVLAIIARAKAKVLETV